MQTVETLNEGLKRAYTLKISAQDIDARVDAEVKRVAPQMRMPGFRPGKVPANLVRKMHGESLAQDALNSTIQEGVQQILTDNKLRPATQPSVSLQDGYARGKDAEVAVELEVLPDVPPVDVAALNLKLERLTVPVAEDAVQAQLTQLASQQKAWEDADADHAAATGDQVTMDFVGKVDDVAFEGGTGEGMAIEIGAGQLIPGFEDQLIGVKVGDEKQINVTFPKDYGQKDLAGKPATFDLKITAVKTAGEAVADEAFAKSLGLESLEQLTGLLKGQLEQETNGLTRTYMKRKLLNQLAAGHDFPVPPSMVEAEFQQIWHQLEHEAGHEADPAAAMAELEAEKEDYRKIAERRVRLGLLLSEIGQANGIEVNQQEMQRLIMQAAQQYSPQDRERFMQYVQQEPMAAAQLRAPLYEDKVVDFLFDKAEVSEREVTREALEAAIESEEGFDTGTHYHDHDNHKPKAAKKGASKKKADDAAPEPAEPVKKATTKKAPAKSDVAAAEPSEDVVAAEPVKKAATKKAPAVQADTAAEATPKKKTTSKKIEG